MTFFHGGREVTVELSDTKLLPSEDLEDLWQWNRRAMLDFIGHAQTGIRGIVTGIGNQPLTARVEVLGVDREFDGSIVRTDENVGDYHRLLLPGLYDLRFEAIGYQPREIYGIAVADGPATVIDVELHQQRIRRPTGRLMPQFK